MREIKFRGKEIETNEWIYGSLVISETSVSIYPKKLYIDSSYKVDPDSVGQFTGLCDKDGRDIYEGDVITNTKAKGVVSFIGAGYFLKTNSGGIDLRFLLRASRNPCEIIGNAFDSPELLTAKTENQ